jgi:hypothetical protein
MMGPSYPVKSEPDRIFPRLRGRRRENCVRVDSNCTVAVDYLTEPGLDGDTVTHIDALGGHHRGIRRGSFGNDHSLMRRLKRQCDQGNFTMLVHDEDDRALKWRIRGKLAAVSDDER